MRELSLHKPMARDASSTPHCSNASQCASPFLAASEWDNSGRYHWCKENFKHQTKQIATWSYSLHPKDAPSMAPTTCLQTGCPKRQEPELISQMASNSAIANVPMDAGGSSCGASAAWVRSEWSWRRVEGRTFCFEAGGGPNG